MNKRNVASSTQRQVLNALVFLYREVLDMHIEGKMMPIRSKKKVHPLLPKKIGEHMHTLHILNYTSGVRILPSRVWQKMFKF